MSSQQVAEDSLECYICCQKKPHYGFSDWKCSGHPEHICKDCAAKCIKCPFCRAEPREPQLPPPAPPEAVVFEYIFETPYIYNEIQSHDLPSEPGVNRSDTRNIINNINNILNEYYTTIINIESNISNRNISLINLSMVYFNPPNTETGAINTSPDPSGVV